MENGKKVKNTFIRIGVLMLLVMLLVSCSKQSNVSSNQGGNTAGKFRIAYISAGSDDMWHNLTARITKQLIESTHSDMEVTIFDGKSKADVFIQLLETVSEDNYGLVIGAVLADIKPQVEALKKKGTPFILYAIEMEDLNGLVSTFVCNEYDLGKFVAERAAEELPQNAQVVFLNGIAGYSGSVLRRQGFQAGLLDKRPDVKLLDEQRADFQKADAMAIMDDWIQRYDKIDGVLAANDAMALGAIESIRSNGKNISDYYVYGIDSLNDACESIAKNELRASARQDSTLYAQAFMERAEKLQRKEVDVNFIEDKQFAPTLTDASNVDALIAFYTEKGFIK